MSDPLDKHLGKQHYDAISILLVGGPQDGAGITHSMYDPVFPVSWRHKEQSKTHYQMLEFKGTLEEREFLIYAAMPTYWGSRHLDMVFDILAASVLRTLEEGDTQFEDDGYLTLEFQENPWNTI